LIQNALKILTLGFFFSMISGFVLYRSGYFEDESQSYLQTSPNGGELLAQVDQDTMKSPEINNANAAPIMPSSKSAVPVIDWEKIELDEKKKMMLYSSKSLTFPVDVKPEMTANQIEDKKREAFRQQPELEPKSDSSELITSEKRDSIQDVGSLKSKKKTVEETESAPINWRAIWIGVLGILFVAIGTIVYFKRRSK